LLLADRIYEIRNNDELKILVEVLKKLIAFIKYLKSKE